MTRATSVFCREQGVTRCSGSEPGQGAHPWFKQPGPRLGGDGHERGSIAGGDEHFTGEATISMLFSPNGPRDRRFRGRCKPERRIGHVLWRAWRAYRRKR